MNILLHICCAPCLLYPFSRLTSRGFQIKGFYYNPNLYPQEEYLRRRGALETISQKFALAVDYPIFRESEFFQVIGSHENLPQRCLICWSLRLRKTAVKAKKEGFSSFSSTLLVSPYQNHELLKQLGEQVAQETGIDFYYEDFRTGFKQAQAQARQLNIYRQKYCGCKYSLPVKGS